MITIDSVLSHTGNIHFCSIIISFYGFPHNYASDYRFGERFHTSHQSTKAKEMLCDLPFRVLECSHASDHYPPRRLCPSPAADGEAGGNAPHHVSSPPPSLVVGMGVGWQTDRNTTMCDLLLAVGGPSSSSSSPSSSSQLPASATHLCGISLATASVTHMSLFEVTKYAGAAAAPDLQSCLTAVRDAASGQSVNAATPLLPRREVLSVYEHKQLFALAPTSAPFPTPSQHQNAAAGSSQQQQSAVLSFGGDASQSGGGGPKAVSFPLPRPLQLHVGATSAPSSSSVRYLLLRLACSWEPSHPIGLSRLTLHGGDAAACAFTQTAAAAYGGGAVFSPTPFAFSQHQNGYQPSQPAVHASQLWAGGVSQSQRSAAQTTSQLAASIISGASDGYLRTRACSDAINAMLGRPEGAGASAIVPALGTTDAAAHKALADQFTIGRGGFVSHAVDVLGQPLQQTHVHQQAPAVSAQPPHVAAPAAVTPPPPAVGHGAAAASLAPCSPPQAYNPYAAYAAAPAAATVVAAATVIAPTAPTAASTLCPPSLGGAANGGGGGGGSYAVVAGGDDTELEGTATESETDDDNADTSHHHSGGRAGKNATANAAVSKATPAAVAADADETDVEVDETDNSNSVSAPPQQQHKHRQQQHFNAALNTVAASTPAAAVVYTNSTVDAPNPYTSSVAPNPYASVVAGVYTPGQRQANPYMVPLSTTATENTGSNVLARASLPPSASNSVAVPTSPQAAPAPNAAVSSAAPSAGGTIIEPTLPTSVPLSAQASVSPARAPIPTSTPPAQHGVYVPGSYGNPYAAAASTATTAAAYPPPPQQPAQQPALQQQQPPSGVYVPGGYVPASTAVANPYAQPPASAQAATPPPAPLAPAATPTPPPPASASPAASASTATAANPLAGVVFVLSGYVNPMRSQLRDGAAALGARCLGDWDPKSCTHLVTVSATTPKYNTALYASVRPHAVHIVGEQWLLAAIAGHTRPPEGPYLVGAGVLQPIP